MLDWIRILDQHHIEWQHGSGDNIEIQCYWCGNADEGKHLSISLTKPAYRCWRRPHEHSGKNPVRLLTALLKISITEARTLAGIKHSESSDNITFRDTIRSALNGHKIDDTSNVRSIKNMVWPKDFRPITKTGVARSVHSYIEWRGYPGQEVDRLIEYYDLRTTLGGTFRYRVVIPIYMPHMGLVNWTGRSITASHYLRYQTLTTNEERAKANGDPVAALSINQTLLNYDKVSADYGRDLVVCEGPFDALKVDHYGRDAGVRAVCTFGKNISDQQINLLSKIRDRYENMWLAQDRDAKMEALATLGRLAHLRVRQLDLPRDVGDPGDLSRAQVLSWI